MAKRSIQGYVELASGLGEMTKDAAKDAAAELVALTNGDLSPKKVTKQASKLADDLVAAAKSNRKSLVALVRSEVDKAVGRLDVDSLQKELANVTATVHALRGQVEDLASSVSGRSTRAASDVATSAAKVVDTAATPAPSRRPARAALKKAATSSATPAKAAAKKAPAKKTTPAKKSAVKAAPAKKAATSSATPAKAAAKKAPAKKTTPAKKSVAKAAPAKKAATSSSTPAKTAAKKAPVKKAPVKKAPAKKATPATAATSTSTTSSAGSA